jgi:UDP-4-amino-4,6-dideoxy-N-acetyl-beta-L-altrosamine N-acetyltransferase
MAAPKVQLRALDPRDKDRLLVWRNSPDVAAYMYTDHKITPAEHAHWFAGIAGDERRAFWIIEMDGAPVGLANLYDIDRRNSRCAWAYYLAEPQVRGKGLGGYVEYQMIEKVFGEFALGKLWCEVLASNAGVIRLHQKFGFKEEARFRRHVLKNGALEDVVGMGLLAEEWAEGRHRLRKTLEAAGFSLASD